MDLSLRVKPSVKFIVKNQKKLKKQIYTLPEEIDKEIASLKLKSMEIEIDKLTAERKKYMSG